MRQCDLAYNVQCSKLTASTVAPKIISSGEGYLLGCRSDGERIIPYPNNCRKYIFCETTRARIFDCLNTEVFNSEKKSCVDEKSYSCNATTYKIISMDSASASGY